MLNERMETALNKQINAELWSAYLYLSMANYCNSKGLPGAANWFEIQFKEEQDHAMRFKNYIQSRGGRVLLEPIAEVKTEWNSLLDAYQDTLEHERKVTAMINNLYALAVEVADAATQNMLNWFVSEQVEEEDAANKLIDALSFIGDNGYGLYMFDKELAARVYTAPTTTEE